MKKCVDPNWLSVQLLCWVTGRELSMRAVHHTTTIPRSRRDKAKLETVDVVLTTYGLMVRDWDDLAEVDWDVLVLDEAQNIKNPVAPTARATGRSSPSIAYALSGTQWKTSWTSCGH